MEGERVLVDLDISSLGVGNEDTSSAPAGIVSSQPAYSFPTTHLSVAICNFAMEVRSSWLPAAERLVSGVPVALPLTESAGVEMDVAVESVVDAPFPLAACLAAFSASRFCFDAEGAMVV